MVDFEDAKSGVRAVIDRVGEDFVYTPIDYICQYINKDGSPSCLVGHYLIDLEVPVSVLEENNYLEFETLVERGILDLWVTFTESAVSALNNAQYNQDFGLTWGTAFIEAFDEE